MFDLFSRGQEVEDCLDLIQFWAIAQNNCATFMDTLAAGSQSKDQGTNWIVAINATRKGVMHPSSDVQLTALQLNDLRDYEAWPRGQCGANVSPDGKEREVLLRTVSAEALSDFSAKETAR